MTGSLRCDRFGEISCRCVNFLTYIRGKVRTHNFSLNFADDFAELRRGSNRPETNGVYERNLRKNSMLEQYSIDIS